MEEPIEIGKKYELDVEIWPTCITVPKGYRIGLSERGKDYTYPGDFTAIPNAIGQPATGVGPFRHEEKSTGLTVFLKISFHFILTMNPVLMCRCPLFVIEMFGVRVPYAIGFAG